MGARAHAARRDARRERDVTGAVVDPTGAYVATNSSDDVVRLWRILKSTAALVEQAKVEAPRCLTPDEREKATLPPEPPDWCIERQR